MLFARFKVLQGIIFAGKDGDPFPNFSDLQNIAYKSYRRNDGKLATDSLKTPLSKNNPPFKILSGMLIKPTPKSFHQGIVVETTFGNNHRRLFRNDLGWCLLV